MADNNHPYVLYDGIILNRLQPRRNTTSLPRRRHSSGMQPFEDLQYPELMRALLDGRYSTAESMLRKLTAPLPPKDAMAACLCALGAPEKRMHTILDHCPPIPEFQFLGVGKTASLLNVVVHLKKHKMLHLLLNRGADPNGGPSPLTETSPLEVAFCNDAYLCLERLLRARDLRLELTPEMLNHWANLHPDFCAASPEDLMCCQELLEALTGQPTDPEDPLPFPPQLTLEIVLKQLNLPLATHICQKRPLADREKEAAVGYLSGDRRIILLDERALDFHLTGHRLHADFLIALLKRHPELLHLPELRFPIISMALATPKPEDALQALVAQLKDGPVFLKELSASGGIYPGGLPVPKLFSRFTLSEYLFPRWDQRLGSRFVPTMDVSADLYLPYMADEEVQLVLDRITFVGRRPTDKLSTVGEQFLRYAPESMLPTLLQPIGLLALEYPQPLLEATLELPTARRNQILPYLHKDVDYEL